jgi:hypothetical protein
VARSVYLTFAAIVIYTLALAGEGVRGFFTADDASNLGVNHGLWRTPVWRLVWESAAMITPAYRPVGGLFYRGLYALAGFDPLPYRIACFALLAMNLALAFAVFRKIGGAAAACAALALTCYNASFIDLYWSTATVYELLCFAFLMGALFYYLRARESGSRGDLGRAFGMFALALGSKETAWMLPAAAACFELLRPLPGAPRWGWIGLTGGVAGVSFLVKRMVPTTMNLSPMYAIHPSGMLQAYERYLSQPLYLPRALEHWELAAALAGLAAAGWRLKSRAYWFGLAFFFLMTLPVAVLSPRSGFVLYIPLAGLGLSGGVALARITRASWITPLAILAALLPAHLWMRGALSIGARAAHQSARQFFAQLGERLPELPKGGRVLVRDDPFAPDDYTLPLLARVFYNDPLALFEREKVVGPLETGALTLYDYFYSPGRGAERNPGRFDPNFALIPVFLSPRRARTGERYSIRVPEWPGRTLDVAYQMPGREAGVIRRWATLDLSGRAELTVPEGHPSATVIIAAIRSQGEVWRPASPAIEIEGVRW